MSWLVRNMSAGSTRRIPPVSVSRRSIAVAVRPSVVAA